MQVTVELFSYFQKGRFVRDTVELLEDATVADLLAQLEINTVNVGVLMINGNSGTKNDQLNMGDKVTLIPIIGGG